MNNSGALWRIKTACQIFKTVLDEHITTVFGARSILWRPGQIAKVSSWQPPVRRSTGVDTNMIVTSPKRAARGRHCNGTTHPTHPVNSTAEGDELRRHPKAQCPSEVGSRRALTHSAKARRAHPKCALSVESPAPSTAVEAVRAAAALGLRRARQGRASGTRAACSSSGSPREKSRSQPM